MIRTKIKIGDDGEIQDTFDVYGLCYLSADKIFAAPAKEMEKTTYPEQEGENLLPVAADDAFDYKVTFLIEAREGLDKVGKVVSIFNNAIRTNASDDDTKIYRQITFYNPARNVTIVGYPKPISAASEYWVDARGNRSDAAKVEFTIRVNKPSLCNFQQCEL